MARAINQITSSQVNMEATTTITAITMLEAGEDLDLGMVHKARKIITTQTLLEAHPLAATFRQRP